jgi:hypothetical protein
MTTVSKSAIELVANDEIRLCGKFQRVLSAVRKANGFVLITLTGYALSVRPSRRFKTI